MLRPCRLLLSGVKADGSAKLRPVDDFTRSGCNPDTCASEKLRYDSGDTFLALLRSAYAFLGPVLSLWKADIDSAYRRLPVEPSQRTLAWVTFLCKGMALVAEHLSMMFGSTSSVHHWDRMGMLLSLPSLAHTLWHVVLQGLLCGP